PATSHLQAFICTPRATPSIYTLSLHDALPISHEMKRPLSKISLPAQLLLMELEQVERGGKSWKDFVPELKKKLSFIVNQSQDAGDRKSTRLNSSHVAISYAVFCLKKKNSPSRI